MKKLKKMFLVLMVAALMFSFAGCGSSEGEGKNPDTESKTAQNPDTDGKSSQGEKSIRVALLLPGSLNDGGWNANAYSGLMELEKEGYEVAFTENIEISAIEEALNNYASNGFDLVIGHGFEFGEPAMRVSSQYPDVNFFVSGKMPDGVDEADIPANVGFMDMKEYEAAYLAGIVAAGMTESNVIGYIAGLEIPAQLSNMAAFVKGVESYNPEAKVYGIVAGTFEDAALGQESATAQIELGADIICQTADSTGMGAIEAAAAKGVYIIGYGADQNEIKPDLILTSIITDNSRVVQSQAELIEKGEFGGLWRPGVADGICFIAPYHGLEDVIPSEVKAAVDKATEDIKNGTLVVPEILERIDHSMN